MTILFLALGLLVVAAVVVWWQRSVDVLIHSYARRTVVVELHSGETFRGLLVATDGRSITLQRAEALGAAQTVPVSVDGELLIPRSDVKYLQRP